MEENGLDKRPLGALIHLTSSNLDGYIDKNLHKKNKEGLTGIEGMALQYVYHHNSSVTVKQIMDFSHVCKATCSQTLNSLYRKGLIVLKDDINDRRKKIIFITERGKEVAAEFDLFFENMNERLEQGISEEEKALLRDILMRFRRNLGKDF